MSFEKDWHLKPYEQLSKEERQVIHEVVKKMFPYLKEKGIVNAK